MFGTIGTVVNMDNREKVEKLLKELQIEYLKGSEKQNTRHRQYKYLGST